MTVINTNVGSLNARVAALKATANMERTMERLSSGKRINSAADDAAGLAVASKMEAQLGGINMAIRNNQDGVGLIQTAESGMQEIRNMLLRIRELAVQMANGIYGNGDRLNADLEVTALLSQIELIADNTRFNGVTLLSSSASKNIQAGPTTAEKIGIKISAVTATGLLVTDAGTSVSTVAKSISAMYRMDRALSAIGKRLATLGSLQNRMSFSINNLSKASVTTEQALGRIMDADFAKESSALAKHQILNQAATSMLAQANQSKQSLLALLQG